MTIVHTDDKLERWQEKVDRLTLCMDDCETADFLQELMAEVRYLTSLSTVVQAQRMFDRFQAFSGIRDDCCPACGGRVAVDESDPNRLRIISDQRVRAS